MIQLTKEQRQALDHGEPIRLVLGARNLVLLRSEIYERIRSVMDSERAIIEAGHTRGPVEAPEPLEPVPAPEEDRTILEGVVLLPGERFGEIHEMVQDDQIRSAWYKAADEAQRSWAQDNPY